MPWETMNKSTGDAAATPNLPDDEAARAAISGEAARRELDGLPSGQSLNIAPEAVDRHAAGPRRDYVAIRWLAPDARCEELSDARRPAPAPRRNLGSYPVATGSFEVCARINRTSSSPTCGKSTYACPTA